MRKVLHCHPPTSELTRLELPTHTPSGHNGLVLFTHQPVDKDDWTPTNPPGTNMTDVLIYLSILYLLYIVL